MLALTSQRQQSEPGPPCLPLRSLLLLFLRGLDSGVSAFPEEVHSFSPAGSTRWEEVVDMYWWPSNSLFLSDSPFPWANLAFQELFL